MKDYRDTFKRQAEIVGLCIGQPYQYHVADFEMMFGCESVTITRDLRALRTQGIDIHSTKQGVKIDGEIPRPVLEAIILQYVGIAESSGKYDKATALLIQRLGARALPNTVSLQRAIEEAKIVCIDYEKSLGQSDKSRVIKPLMLYQNDGEWRLIALHEEKMKQFLLAKIRNVIRTEKTFDRSAIHKARKMLQYSWNSWLGEDRIEIQIELSKDMMKLLSHKRYTEDQRFVKKHDGSAVLEATVSSLLEVAGWVVSRGRGVKVLQPEELKNIVIGLAKDTLSNYS
jgi:predicted DNA-binding transcriptional regulator YafY